MSKKVQTVESLERRLIVADVKAMKRDKRYAERREALRRKTARQLKVRGVVL